jgi:hypothetical protein
MNTLLPSQFHEGLPMNVARTGLAYNRPFCLMASPALQTATITGSTSDSACEWVYVCLGSARFTLIQHQLILPASVSQLSSSTVCSLFVFQASLTLLQFTRHSVTLCLYQIRSSVFFAFLQPLLTFCDLK